jgi:hypothetical protein
LIALPSRPLKACRFKEGDKEADDSLGSLTTQKDRLKEGLKAKSDNLKDKLASTFEQPSMNAQVKVNPAVPAFTRRREILAGRIAMLGYTAAVGGELVGYNHPNILQQVTNWGSAIGLSIPPPVVLALILGLIGYNAVAALGPGSPTFSQENQQDVHKRESGSYNTETPSWAPGFTKANELFNGRMAMLGIAAALLNQMWIGGFDGPGPLAQVAHFLNIPADAAFYGLMGPSFVAFSVIATTLAFATGNVGAKPGDEDIY